jgi:hypothetical protein
MLRFARGLRDDLRLALLARRLRRFPEDLRLRAAAAALHCRRAERFSERSERSESEELQQAVSGETSHGDTWRIVTWNIIYIYRWNIIIHYIFWEYHGNNIINWNNNEDS